MTYKQLRSFNTSKAGTQKGWCLKNVRLGFGISAVYPDAWTAWKNTQQHTGAIPAGLDVPLFFSYTATIDGVRRNWGHIGVRLKDGRFWSDGKTYSSYKTYEAAHSPKYVGWGESVNNVRVIGEDVYKGYDAVHWYNLAASRAKTIASLETNVKAATEQVAKLREELSIRPTDTQLKEQLSRAEKAEKELASALIALKEEQSEPDWTDENVVKYIWNKIKSFFGR